MKYAVTSHLPYEMPFDIHISATKLLGETFLDDGFPEEIDLDYYLVTLRVLATKLSFFEILRFR